MSLTYRKAVPDDHAEIMRLIRSAIHEMERLHIHQWDEQYPTDEDIAADIRNQTLTIGISENQIAVIYTINQECDDAYENADWSYHGTAFAVLHRLCVQPAMQNQGVAGETLTHIETELRRYKCKAIRLDVFSENPYALVLYRHNGFHETGTANWRKGKFLLMEKLL